MNGGPSLPQQRNLVTEIPGPESLARLDRKKTHVADGVGTTLPVFVVAAGGGSIVLISSAAGLKVQPFMIPYTTSKWAVRGMAKAFAAELARHHVRVNSVHPTGVATPMGSGDMQAVLGEATLILPLAGVIDLAAERARLAKDRAKAEAEARKVEAKLANADFVARAKEEVVEENRERLANFRAEMARLDAAMARLAG